MNRSPSSGSPRAVTVPGLAETKAGGWPSGAGSVTVVPRSREPYVALVHQWRQSPAGRYTVAVEAPGVMTGATRYASPTMNCTVARPARNDGRVPKAARGEKGGRRGVDTA